MDSEYLSNYRRFSKISKNYLVALKNIVKYIGKLENKKESMLRPDDDSKKEVVLKTDEGNKKDAIAKIDALFKKVKDT